MVPRWGFGREAKLKLACVIYNVNNVEVDVPGTCSFHGLQAGVVRQRRQMRSAGREASIGNSSLPLRIVQAKPSTVGGVAVPTIKLTVPAPHLALIGLVATTTTMYATDKKRGR